MLFFLDSLQINLSYVYLQCVFHSIRFKVNKRLEYGGTPFFIYILILLNIQSNRSASYSQNGKTVFE